MIGPRTAFLAVILASAALALGACGGDDNSDQAATTGTNAGTQTTGTGTTETGKTTGTRERKGEDRGGKQGSGNGGGSGGSGGGGSQGSGSQGGGSGSDSSSQLNQGNTRRTAKRVCSDFLPPVLARQIKSGKKSEKEVAKDYAKGFPRNLRDLAYAGCLAGLKSR
jgi:hypothetical protein